MFNSRRQLILYTPWKNPVSYAWNHFERKNFYPINVVNLQNIDCIWRQRYSVINQIKIPGQMCYKYPKETYGLPLLVQFKRQQQHRDISNNCVCLAHYNRFEGHGKRKMQFVNTAIWAVFWELVK
jgi:hypothetical protein